MYKKKEEEARLGKTGMTWISPLFWLEIPDFSGDDERD